MATLRRVRTVFTGVAGTPWYSNLYFAQNATPVNDVIDMVRDFWTALAGQIDNGVTATVEGDVALLDDATGNIVGIDSGTALVVVGTATGSAMPPATQGVLHLLTSTFLAGRQLRGKVFIPGLTVGAGDTLGAPTSGFKSTLLTAAGALSTAAGSFGPWRVLSKTGGTSAVVASTTTPSKFGVLRSRRD